MTKLIKKWILRNWIGKLAALVLAIAIWYLIRQNLDDDRNDNPFPNAPKATPVEEG